MFKIADKKEKCMSLPWYIPLIKIFFMSISNYYTVIRIANIEIKDRILILIMCLQNGVIYAIIRNNTNILIAYPIYYLIFSVTYSVLANIKIKERI